MTDSTSTPGAPQGSHERPSFLRRHYRLFLVLMLLGAIPGLIIKGCQGSSTGDYFVGTPVAALSLAAEPDEFVGGSQDVVVLRASYPGGVTPDSFTFSQTSGPSAAIEVVSAAEARVNVKPIVVTEDTPLVFRLTARLGELELEATAQVLALPYREYPGTSLPALDLTLTATPAVFEEGTVQEVTLTASSSVPIEITGRRQARGPRAGQIREDPKGWTVDVSKLQVAVDTALEFQVDVVAEDGRTGSAKATVGVIARDLIPALGQNVQIGGQTTAAARLETEGGDWIVYNVGNRLSLTPVTPGGEVRSLYAPAFIRDIDLVSLQGRTYALLAMGTGGIGVVDVTAPQEPTFVRAVPVGHHQAGITLTDGGGNVVTDFVISATTAPVSALVTDGETLWIADAGFGLHRTALLNLLAAGGPVLAEDNTLAVEASRFTLQYAGESPWGGPSSLRLVEGRLFAALSFLGMGIFDPLSLEPVGAYNLYTDVSVVEDWFVGMDVADQVQDGYLDPVTGMPDYRQVQFEISQVWRGGVEAPTPYADFQGRGKYYYNIRDVDVVQHGERSVALLSYGLAGLVAVDVTGFQEAGPGGEGQAAFLRATYMGYVPASPAHGPRKPTGSGEEQSGPFLDLTQKGMLSEAGVVSAHSDGVNVYYTDHFAGLCVVPLDVSLWHGPSSPYDNDDPTLAEGILGDHWPRWEYVTSYDMSPVDDADEESPPVFFTQEPFLLVTGELGGHPGAFLLAAELTMGAPEAPAEGDDEEPAPETPAVDVVVCSGGGGLAYVDLIDLSLPTYEERFALLASYHTTDEVGAAQDGSPTQAIDIGHTDGVAVADGYLYVADGPHGVSAWKVRGGDGLPTADIHVVANSFQSEHAVVIGETTFYPVPHAHGIGLASPDTAMVACRSAGLRRLDVSRVRGGQGQVGAPLLLNLTRQDIFEHTSEEFDLEEEEVRPPLPFQDYATESRVVGNLAFVSDGRSGLTVYDLTRDPTDITFAFLRANLGGEKKKPLLGRAMGLELWADPARGAYAFVACGSAGIGVVDLSSLDALRLVKTFQPIKVEVEEGEEGEEPSVRVSAADGTCVDVAVAGEYAYFSYDSFGVVCYRIDDLIAPLPPGVDPTALWSFQGGSLQYDHRPVAVSELRLGEVPGYEGADGGALGLLAAHVDGRTTLYVAYGVAGVARIDYRDPAHPALTHLVPTVGTATALATGDGWLYVADHEGGLLFFR